MKHLLFAFCMLLTLSFAAQDPDKTVTLKSSGSGTTQEQAKNNALRSAVEQAYGAFISSKTEILNDQVVADEIVSIASGNIQAFKILEEQHTDSLDFCLLEAVVSISKLTSFAQSKGYSVEVQGGLFAMNIKQKQLNETAEVVAVNNALSAALEILSQGFDFKINTSEPTVNDPIKNTWKIGITVTSMNNVNYVNGHKILRSLLKNIGMSSTEQAEYRNLGKKVYEIHYHTPESTIENYYLRTSDGFWGFIRWSYKILTLTQCYKVDDGLSEPYNGQYLDYIGYSSVQFHKLLEKMKDQYKNDLINGVQGINYQFNEQYFKNGQFKNEDKAFPHYGDKYYSNSPIICANVLDYYELKTDITSTANFNLIYDLAKIEKINEIKISKYTIKNKNFNSDFLPYISSWLLQERSNISLSDPCQEIYKKKFTFSASAQEMGSQQLADEINRINDAIPCLPMTMLARQLIDSSAWLKEVGLQSGLYVVKFNYVIESNGLISTTKIDEVKIKHKTKLIEQFNEGIYVNLSNKIHENMDKLNDPDEINIFNKHINQECSKVNKYPAALVSYPNFCPEHLTRCFKHDSFSIYIN